LHCSRLQASDVVNEFHTTVTCSNLDLR